MVPDGKGGMRPIEFSDPTYESVLTYERLNDPRLFF
jgi:hypothetical protein